MLLVRPFPGENTVDRVLFGIMTSRNQIPRVFFSQNFLPDALRRQTLFLQFQDMVTQFFHFFDFFLQGIIAVFYRAFEVAEDCVDFKFGQIFYRLQYLQIIFITPEVYKSRPAKKISGEDPFFVRLI
ncbi:MAG: hypothetical protein MZV70_20625 [Desulfobacterales bacterium]|nr:hypothetical protein [Desulfobacterales bacterium]